MVSNLAHQNSTTQIIALQIKFDEDILYIKIVVLKKIHNFIIDDFPFEIIYILKIVFKVFIIWNSIF
jgi:hypothetical protein